jgi:hypothetical protein
MIALWRTCFKRYSGTMRPRVIGACVLIFFIALWFRPNHSEVPPTAPQPVTQGRVVPATTSDSTPRKVYPLSVIHGGAFSEKELDRARKTDVVVAAHYANFGSKPRFEKLSRESLMYVSYRRSDRVYWSKVRHRIPQGEMVISDGNNMARARCGNRLSATPQSPVGPSEPNEEVLNTPEAPDEPVSYKLAELPGPAGRPLNFVLPSAFDESPLTPGTPQVPVSSGLMAYNSPGTYFAPGPGGFGGGGSTPLSGGSNSVSSGLPTTTTGGTSLPVAPGYPADGPIPAGIPSETLVEVAPEPGAFGYSLLTMFLASAWLARTRFRPGLLRG